MLDPIQGVKRLCNEYGRKEFTTIRSVELEATVKKPLSKHKPGETERANDE